MPPTNTGISHTSTKAVTSSRSRRLIRVTRETTRYRWRKTNVLCGARSCFCHGRTATAVHVIQNLSTLRKMHHQAQPHWWKIYLLGRGPRVLKIRPIPELHNYQILLLVHKFLYHSNELPAAFDGYFVPNSAVYSYSTIEVAVIYIWCPHKLLLVKINKV